MKNIFEAFDEIKMGFIDIFTIAIYSPWVSNNLLKIFVNTQLLECK